VGIVTRGDLLRAQQAPGAGTLTVLQAGTAQPVTAFVDETLSSAMSRMLQRDIGRLPVVERSAPRRVVGYLGRAEILAARLRHGDEEQRREKWPFPARGPA
jgi:CBS domain-containing protein